MQGIALVVLNTLFYLHKRENILAIEGNYLGGPEPEELRRKQLYL